MHFIINENFDYNDLLSHVKHAVEYKSDERCSNEVFNLLKAIEEFGHKYNIIADQLVMTPAGTSLSNDDIVGYMKDGRTACKYNKLTGDFVAYKHKSPRYKTITLHKKTYDQYLRIRDRDFYSELPENID